MHELELAVFLETWVSFSVLTCIMIYSGTPTKNKKWKNSPHHQPAYLISLERTSVYCMFYFSNVQGCRFSMENKLGSSLRLVFPRHSLPWKASLFWNVCFFFLRTCKIMCLLSKDLSLTQTTLKLFNFCNMEYKLQLAYCLEYSGTGMLWDAFLLIFNPSYCHAISHSHIVLFHY